MTLLDDVAAALPALSRLPGALLRRGWRVTTELGPGSVRPPVLLVSGYCGTDVVWDPLAQALGEAGFAVARFSYHPYAAGVPELVAALGAAARAVAAATDAPGLHLVGHSLGGLLVRRAVQGRALGVSALTAVTIATPHAGSAVGALAVGPCAEALRPRAPGAVPERLDPATRWFSFYSDTDPVVPPVSARLEPQGGHVVNVRVGGRGHLTICRDPRLVSGVVSALTDEPREVPGAVRSGPALADGEPAWVAAGLAA